MMPKGIFIFESLPVVSQENWLKVLEKRYERYGSDIQWFQCYFEIIFCSLKNCKNWMNHKNYFVGFRELIEITKCYVVCVGLKFLTLNVEEKQ